MLPGCLANNGAGPIFRVVEEIIEYVTRDLRAPEGGFYSAEDADSEGVEGKYYVWTTQEVRKILAGPKAEEFIDLYNFEPEGNYRTEDTGQFNGMIIL